MLDSIDALVALETFGTVSEAATRLRLTQSAVSKRLQSLQATVGFALVEPDGRRLRLTPAALGFLARARPLVAELRGLLQTPTEATSPPRLSLAVADSIASSWGPAVVRRAMDSLPGSRIELHAHRSVLVIESVRLGRYDVGLCTATSSAGDLVPFALAEEPLVLVHAGLAARPRRGAPLVTIEATSATWRAIEADLRAAHPKLVTEPPVSVESFGAVVQMARAGFGNGLVPLGLALDSRIPKKAFRTLKGVARKIALYTRKTIAAQPGFLAFRDELARATAAHLASSR